MTRKLVTIRTIKDIQPIPGADNIVVAYVDGWRVVVKKNEFSVGDKCFYFELDSFLPDGNDNWQFLVDKYPTTFDGNLGHVVRTVKLRNQVSQGFALPLTAFDLDLMDLDGDIAEQLNIVKWEYQLPDELKGKAKGGIPSFLSKPDQERAQNLEDVIFGEHKDTEFEITIKLDGTSMVAYHYNGEMGVCSKYIEWLLDNEDNPFVKMFHESNLSKILPHMGNFAVLGELMGPKIQKNREGLRKHELFIFDIYDIDNGKYLEPEEARLFILQLYNRGLELGLVSGVVPLRGGVFTTLQSIGITDIDALLNEAKGPSIKHKTREGIVFKSRKGRFTFKVINNDYLLKQ